MAFGPDLQHHGVVLSDHRARGLGPQRRDRDRQRVIRVVLTDVPGAGNRTRAASLAGTSSTCSPAATSCRASRCPARRRPPPPRPAPARPAPRRPAAQPDPGRRGLASCPVAALAGRPPPRCASPRAGRPRSSLPSSAHSTSSSRGTGRSAAGMPYYSAGARAPFEPHRGETRQAGTSLSSQATVRGRQADTEPAHRAPQRYGLAHCHPGQIRNAYRGVSIRAATHGSADERASHARVRRSPA